MEKGEISRNMLTLIANTGIQLFTFRVKIDSQERFKMWFHEWYDTLNGQWKMELAEEVIYEDVSYYYDKYKLFDEGYLIDNVFAVVKRHIAPEYIDFLAQPRCLTNKDCIYWYVCKWNEELSRYNNLDEVEKIKYNVIKEKTIAEYKKLEAKLSGTERQLICGALKYVNDDFMFCYDNKVVLVAW